MSSDSLTDLTIPTNHFMMDNNSTHHKSNSEQPRTRLAKGEPDGAESIGRKHIGGCDMLRFLGRRSMQQPNTGSLDYKRPTRSHHANREANDTPAAGPNPTATNQTPHASSYRSADKRPSPAAPTSGRSVVHRDTRHLMHGPGARSSSPTRRRTVANNRTTPDLRRNNYNQVPRTTGVPQTTPSE